MRLLHLLLAALAATQIAAANLRPDYASALQKSLLFFEAQRSGPLPPNQRLTWRGDSAMKDGYSQGVDLVGGYYDAGDHVKFGLPMAFTVTILSWSVIEYRSQLKMAGQLGYALEAVKWGTDYLLKAHPEPNVLWAEVGDGESDHSCWQRAEDMSTSRFAYRVDEYSPGSDVAAESAAALAAASLVFGKYNSSYAGVLLGHARQLFELADKFRGKYDDSIGVAKKYYPSSGFNDELLWAAAWLYEATGEDSYLTYLVNNAQTLGGTTWPASEFSWDVKYAGLQILAAKILLQGRAGRATNTLTQYKSKADHFACTTLQKNYDSNVRRTPGGLLYIREWDNMQYVSASSFLLSVYSDHLGSQSIYCPSGAVQASAMSEFAESQVKYILGQNPRGMSYMVGYGSVYPQQVHHRGASIVSIKLNPGFVGCLQGYSEWYNRDSPDSNILTGALVGGPDINDNFDDDRGNYEQTEAPMYNNAPLVGLLARFYGIEHKRSVSQRPRSQTPAYSEQDIEILHAITGWWRSNGRIYYRHRITVINNTKKAIRHITFLIKNLQGPLWGLSAERGGGGRYTLPSWIRVLNAGQRFHFVYVQAGPQARISVSSYY